MEITDKSPNTGRQSNQARVQNITGSQKQKRQIKKQKSSTQRESIHGTGRQKNAGEWSGHITIWQRDKGTRY